MELINREKTMGEIPIDVCDGFEVTDIIEKIPTVDAIPRENIKLLGEELRKVREGITDEKVLIGFNMAIAICNKYLEENDYLDKKSESWRIE